MKYHLITIGFALLAIALIVLFFKYTIFFTIAVLVATALGALVTFHISIYNWVKEVWEK